MSSRFVLGRENVPCIAEVVNRSLKADCTDFTSGFVHLFLMFIVEKLSKDSAEKPLQRFLSFLPK